MVEDATFKINSDLARVFEWAEKNQLQLNPKKSQAIVIHKNPIDTSCFPKIELGSSSLPYVEKVKNLGIIFNQTLTWGDHISSTLGKTYGALRALYVSGGCLPINVKCTLVKTLVLPILTYGSLIFCDLDSTCQRKIQVAFNNVIRFVFSLRRFDHVSNYANIFYGMSFRSYLDRKALLFLFNLTQTKTPDYLYDKLVFPQSQRSRVLIVPTHRYNVSKRQFFVYAVGLWNSLPANVRRINNCNSFKTALDNYLRC